MIYLFHKHPKWSAIIIITVLMRYRTIRFLEIVTKSQWIWHV